MIVNGVYVPNIICPRCKYRHPAELSCAEADAIAQVGKDERAAWGVADQAELLARTFGAVPWSVGFSNEIADKLCAGNYQPDMVRYAAVNICAADGSHVAWASSPALAELIVNVVNRS